MVAKNRVQDETVNDLVYEIKGFFRLRDADFDLKTDEDEEAIYYTIEPKEWIKVSWEKYEKFVGLLGSLGYYWSNGAKNTVTNFIGYQYIIGTEEFEGDDGTEIIYEFSEEIINGKVRVYIRSITIKKNKNGDDSRQHNGQVGEVGSGSGY